MKQCGHDGLCLMPNGHQIGSDSFQTRSDQAWTEMAWEVSAAGTGSAFIQNRKSHFWHGKWMVLTLWRKGQEELPALGGSWNLPL